MTIDNLVPVLIVGVIVISSVVSGLKQAKRGFDNVVAKQRADEPQRLAALEARMKARGMTASPALQRLIATLDTVAQAETPAAQVPRAPDAAQAGYTAQTPYAPQAGYTAQTPYAPQAAYVPPAPYAPPPALAAAQQAVPQIAATATRHGRHHRQQQPPPEPPPEVVRAPASIARSMDVPAFPAAAPAAASSVRRTLAEAFADPAHARNAVILLEVLGPPVALR